jgi:anti-sigma factor RsiW
MSAIDEDALLVAFIDGELDERARADLEVRLAIDPDLHERLMRLKEGGRLFAAAFDTLLDDAPVQRLEAALASYIQRGERRPMSIRASLRLQAGRLGVAAAVIVFCAGIAVGRYGPS